MEKQNILFNKVWNYDFSSLNFNSHFMISPIIFFLKHSIEVWPRCWNRKTLRLPPSTRTPKLQLLAEKLSMRMT